MMDAGADIIGDPSQSHCVARLMPRRRCTTVAAFGTAWIAYRWVLSESRRRTFYDEGEDFWPKRYAIWGHGGSTAVTNWLFDY